jgi:hypothetical protein
MATTQALAGRTVLLVEDIFFIAHEAIRRLEEGGAAVVGPASDVAGALDLIEKASLDGAVLDIDLKGEMVYPVADVLTARGVPFVFATCCPGPMIPPRYAGVARFGKEIDPHTVAHALFA